MQFNTWAVLHGVDRNFNYIESDDRSQTSIYAAVTFNVWRNVLFVLNIVMIDNTIIFYVLITEESSTE